MPGYNVSKGLRLTVVYDTDCFATICYDLPALQAANKEEGLNFLAIATKPGSADNLENEAVSPDQLVTISEIHWGMRLMSLVSLLALGFYTYVLWLCRRRSRAATLN